MRVIARVSRRHLAGLLMAVAGLGAAQAAWADNGLKLEPQGLGRWQARIQLNSLDVNAGLQADPLRSGGSRLLSANLLGDYYLTGSGLGQGVQGGLRATGGLLLGPLSLAQSSSGLALGRGATLQSQNFALGQRSVSVQSSAERGDPSTSLSYLGIGYTGHSLRGGWGFSADLGLVGGYGGFRLGQSSAQAVEDLLRDMRYKPVLQLGLSYSY
ncbi:hypothetical protein [Paucibacter soli]|uniref:hypothetical protein n=1 Tax=Paucibacter soli TaxID=3133433 RepID=UPI0030A882D1